MQPWTIEQIEQILPQRYPFLFIDKVVSIDMAAQQVVCIKNFTINDYFFKGHFPGNPVVPGVIMIEALAQAGIIAYSQAKPEIAAKKPDYLFGKVEAKFKRKVVPGDTLTITVTILKVTNSAAIIETVGKVGEETAIEATISVGVISKQ